MILEDIRELKTTPRDLRKFGLMVGGVLVVLGGLFLLRHKPHYPYFLWPGLALVLFGAILPKTLKFVYLAWMSVAVVLGFIVSTVILTLFFFLVITPIGLAARVAGKDFLRAKLDREAKTYWLPRPKHTVTSPADYERQF